MISFFSIDPKYIHRPFLFSAQKPAEDFSHDLTGINLALTKVRVWAGNPCIKRGPLLRIAKSGFFVIKILFTVHLFCHINNF